MTVRIIVGDCRNTLRDLPNGSVHSVVTSPPYFGLRDYDADGQIGLEKSPEDFVFELVSVFREVRRVLRDDGTVWLNLGDSYNGTGSRVANTRDNGTFSFRGGHPGVNVAGLKPKDLIGIPWMVAFALRNDGWFLRQEIIWHKPNPMPESVGDRCTKAHEQIFLLSKSSRYYFDAEAIEEDATSSDRGPNYEGRGQRALARKRGTPPRHSKYASSDQSGLDAVGRGGKRNKRSVWTVATKPFRGAHFATFPPELIAPCILAGTPPGGVVLDPFGGAGTTGLVADSLRRNAVLLEVNPGYAEIARERIGGAFGLGVRQEAAE
ncbi:site-specific DNA-methyltransferase [Agrobacterium deltaense]